jgi:lysophospholipase L1-like esterase
MAKNRPPNSYVPNSAAQNNQPKKSRKIFYWILALLCLACVEAVGQIIYCVKFQPQERKMLAAFMGLGSGYDPDMVSNYHPHPYLVYVLNPNVKWNYETYFGVEPKQLINSQGFRGKEFSVEKPKDVYRIVCLGGSTTFGLGEPDETMTYPAQLETVLNKMLPGKRRFEVINAGTPGWSSAESLINLHFRVLELSPDMIIVYEGINDTFAMRKPEEGKSDNSNFRKIVNYKMPNAFTRFWLRISAACRLLYYWTTDDISFDINSLAVKGAPRGFSEIDQLNKATGKYFKRNIETIVAIARAHHVKPVLVTMGHGPWHPSLGLTCQIVRDVAASENVSLVDFERYSRPGYFDIDNVHLLRAGNSALAQAIAETLIKNGTLRSN